MNKPTVSVEIFDTTLRDGAQALPEESQFPYGAKEEIADHIARLGIGVIEAGFPRSEGDGPEVLAVAKKVGNTKYEAESWRNGELLGAETAYPVITGLSRTTFLDIDTTWEAVCGAVRPRIHTFVSTDAEHIAARFANKTPQQVLEMGQQAVAHAVELTADHPGASVEFSAEAASTTDIGYLERVVKAALEEGADVINVPDTVGQRQPFWMRDFYSTIIDWVMDFHPEVTISAHNHNDIDMATANSLSLVAAAADYASRESKSVKVQIETAICGLGERAGNADVFPVVASLFKFSQELPADIVWQFNPNRSVKVANTVMEYAGLEVHRQSPIVGEDINVHRSGIHSDGILKADFSIYTPYDPRFWGHLRPAEHQEGRYQGKAGRAAITG
jgi:2-isopropylmalate synthase